MVVLEIFSFGIKFMGNNMNKQLNELVNLFTLRQEFQSQCRGQNKMKRLEYHLAFSSAMSVKYEEKRGRFAIANRDIKAGETLVYETPTGARVRKNYEKEHCENCLR